MKTLVLEKNNRIFLTCPVGVIKKPEDIPADSAAIDADWARGQIEESNPMIKWIVGDFVEADHPNTNTQFWTAEDLALGEYSIKYAPLNMLHKQRVPVGFYLATKTISLGKDEAAVGGTAKIQALAGMWTHVFPFESAIVDQASEAGNLYFSMECRGTEVHCAGPNGCDKSFDYMIPEIHCEHLRDRSSIRHIVNPTFRGGALIVPPTRPGWNGAHAMVLREESVREEASLYAAQTESSFDQAISEGREMTPYAWESLMALIVSQQE